MNTVSLDAARSERREQYDGLTCACGSSWFTVQAVAIGSDGRITAYVAPVACRECGSVVKAGAWVPPNLRPVDRTASCPCRPENGGSGVCGCVLGGPKVTC